MCYVLTKEDSASPYKMDTAEEGKLSRHGGSLAAVCLSVCLLFAFKCALTDVCLSLCDDLDLGVQPNLHL